MKYFSGRSTDLGNVSALPQPSFEQLCRGVLLVPRSLPITKAQLLALPHKEQGLAKRVAYITPAAFGSSPSPRKTEEATHCNLIALDVDDSVEAARLLAQGFAPVLGELGFVAYHTARSTPDAPRLRVIVSADTIPAPKYGAAVRTVASLLGLSTPTRESLVPVQPMYLPTAFEGDTQSPIIKSNAMGDSFTVDDIAEAQESEEPSVEAPADPEGEVKDISFLRTPLEDVTQADVQGALAVLDPDCPMAQWIEVGAGLKHQFGDAGFDLWSAWSQKGKKYDEEEMQPRWRSLKANPEGRHPVTLRSVFRLAQARGWENPALGSRAHTATMDWLRSDSRSGEQLLDEGCQRIAKVGPTIDTLARKSLIITLRERLVEMKLPVPLQDLRRKVKQLELDASKDGVPPWSKGLAYVTSGNFFYRPATDRRFTPEVIDLMYSVPQVGDEKPLRPRDYLIQIAQVPQVENLRYEPAHGSKRLFKDGEVPYINTYRPCGLVPDKDGAAEAGDLFQTHIGHLIKEVEYQKLLIDFLAFHIQKPGQKIRFATVLQGAQGCGKSFIGAAMAALLGRRNVRKLTASDVMEGAHNGWAYGQQLIVLEEVRIAGSNRYAVMDRLKPCISDDEISVRRLYEPHQTVPNVCNYLMFTNHHDSLAVHDDDRRYFVLASPLQSAGAIARLGGQPYFDRLFGMLRDNAGGLLSWFQDWPMGAGFKPDGRAPVTVYLRELADAAASPLSSAVQQAIEDEAHPLVRKDLVSLSCLRACMDGQNLREFSDQALSGVLRELGWMKFGRHLVGDARHRLWIKGSVSDPLGRARERLEFL